MISSAPEPHALGVGGDRLHRLLQLAHRRVEIGAQFFVIAAEIAWSGGTADRRRRVSPAPSATECTTNSCCFAAAARSASMRWRSCSAAWRCASASASRRCFSRPASLNTCTARAMPPISSLRSMPVTFVCRSPPDRRPITPCNAFTGAEIPDRGPQKSRPASSAPGRPGSGSRVIEIVPLVIAVRDENWVFSWPATRSISETMLLLKATNWGTHLLRNSPCMVAPPPSAAADGGQLTRIAALPVSELQPFRFQLLHNCGILRICRHSLPQEHRHMAAQPRYFSQRRLIAQTPPCSPPARLGRNVRFQARRWPAVARSAPRSRLRGNFVPGINGAHLVCRRNQSRPRQRSQRRPGLSGFSRQWEDFSRKPPLIKDALEASG